MQSGNSQNQKANKAKPGTVQIRCCNDRLRLVFRFGGKRYFIALSLSDTPYHRKLAQDKALEIERDIQYGEFDATLQKYKAKSVLSTSDPVANIASAPLALRQLWEQYVEYKRPKVSHNTIACTYEAVAIHLSRCRTDGLKDALKLRTELLQITLNHKYVEH